MINAYHSSINYLFKQWINKRNQSRLSMNVCHGPDMPFKILYCNQQSSASSSLLYKSIWSDVYVADLI